jgi:hypothetical protein
MWAGAGIAPDERISKRVDAGQVQRPRNIDWQQIANNPGTWERALYRAGTRPGVHFSR